MILINGGTLAQGIANWPPKFDGILFSALGPYKPKSSAFINNLGQIEKCFSMLPLVRCQTPQMSSVWCWFQA